MIIPTIRTARLSLRPWTLADAPELFQILQDRETLRYLPNTNPPPVERVEKYIARQLKNWEESGFGHWAVTFVDSGELLGWVGLEFLSELNETEVAYLLAKNAWGQGLATEAAIASVHYGFETAALERIIGLVHPENIASARVLEKCGMAFRDDLHLWGIDLRRYQVDRPGREAAR